MPRVTRTPRAELDLVETWLHIAEDSIPAADRFLDAIDQKCQMLSEFPQSGPSREELGRGLRSTPVGSYVIFYRPMPDGIDVIRVLNGSRDLPPLL